MGHHHDQKTLSAIFAHPMSMNLKWKDVEHLLEAAGAEIQPAHSGREVKVVLNGVDRTLHVPHGATIESKDQMTDLRHFLEEAGLTPGAAG
jgi:hypothetical protein